VEENPHGRHPHHADKDNKRDPNDPGLDRIARRRQYDFPVNILCWDNLDNGMALIDRTPTRASSRPPLAPAAAVPAPRSLRRTFGPTSRGAGARQAQDCVIKVSVACRYSKDP